MTDTPGTPGDAGTRSAPAPASGAPAGYAAALPRLAALLAPEPPGAAGARARAAEVGAVPVDPAAGAVPAALAAATGGRAAAEVGTGTGASALWLLSGLPAGAVLTSVDAEPELQRAAREALAEGGVPAGRVRLIAGAAQEVLPRLTGAAYDLVHLDLPLEQALDLLPEAVRLLRPGGVLAVSRATAAGRAASDSARDAEAVAARGLLRAVRDDEALVAALVPAGDDALLVATRR